MGNIKESYIVYWVDNKNRDHESFLLADNEEDAKWNVGYIYKDCSKVINAKKEKLSF